VSMATAQMSAQAGEVVTSATALSAMAAQLDELVARFRIDDGPATGSTGAGATIIGLPRNRAA